MDENESVPEGNQDAKGYRWFCRLCVACLVVSVPVDLLMLGVIYLLFRQLMDVTGH